MSAAPGAGRLAIGVADLDLTTRPPQALNSRNAVQSAKAKRPDTVRRPSGAGEGEAALAFLASARPCGPPIRPTWAVVSREFIEL